MKQTRFRPITPRFLAFESLKRLRAKATENSPIVVGILIDQDARRFDQVQRGVKEYALDFPIRHEPRDDEGVSLASSLRIWNTPCFLRLDGEGRIDAVCGKPGPLFE
ncbi:MAG: hypothetical protein V2A76_01750 [Planctomycetota bacterium]